MNKEPYIYGKNAVLEAIFSGAINIEKIFFCYGINNSHISKQAKKNKIHCTTLDKNKFKDLEKKITFKGNNSQGVIALLSIVDTIDLFDYLQEIDMSTNPILVIIDSVSDPQNLGAIARSVECAGISSMILSNKNTAPITPAVVKTSAGAINHIKIIKVNNLINVCEILKKYGFWIVGTDSHGKEKYTDNIYDKPIALIVGSEGKGMSPSLIKHCDHLISIDMYGKINSLNVSVATGVIFFEILRQRRI